MAIAAAALAAALVVGCDSDDPPEPLRLQSLVLQDSDLPDPFEAFASGPALRPEGAGRRADRARFGRRRGWSASYRRPGSASTAGPLVVVSRVDEFADAEGAERALAEVGAQFRRLGRPLTPPPLGDEAVAIVQTRRAGAAPARFYTIAWRDDRLTGSLRVSGFALDADEAFALARTQQDRMARELRL